MAIGIPPWLESNPAAPAHAFLQAFGQGAQVGESNRRADQADIESSRRADQSAAELEFRRQQEERVNRLKETAQQIQLAEFGQNLRLKQEAADRAAKTAAIQLEGATGLQADLDAGMTIDKAFPKWATKILAAHPQSIGTSIKALQPPPNPTWNEPGAFGEGSPGVFTTPGRAPTVPPASAMDEDFDPYLQDLGRGVTVVHTGPRRTQVIDKPLPKGRMEEVDRLEMKDLVKEHADRTMGRLLVDPKDLKDYDAGTKELADQISALRGKYHGATEQKTGAAPAAPLPMPDKKESLQTGKLYKTARGLATWDGTKFIPFVQ